jgi:hypothetical protein
MMGFSISNAYDAELISNVKDNIRPSKNIRMLFMIVLNVSFSAQVFPDSYKYNSGKLTKKIIFRG